MKLKLRHKVPAVLGAALLLTGGTGAAAYALVAQTSTSPTRSGNELPIDDNHKAVEPTHAPEAGDDHGQSATPTTAHGVEAPHVEGTPKASESPEAAQAPEAEATAEPGDDHGNDATPEPEHTSHRGSGSSGSANSGSGKSGSDDATPEPAETADAPEPTEATGAPAASIDGHGSGHGGSGHDSGHDGSGDSHGGGGDH